MTHHASTRHHRRKPTKTQTRDHSKGWLFMLNRFWGTYFHKHLQSALLSLGQISRRPLTSSMICAVIAIALALPAGLFIILENTKALSKTWDDSSPIMLYLTHQETNDRAKALAEEIKLRPEIEKVDYISPEQGLLDFEKQSGLGDILGTLKENPLPGLLIVTPASNWRTPEAMGILLDSFKLLPEVEMAQLDLEWIKRLDAILSLGKRVIYAVSMLFCLGVIFIVGSTIHLAMQHHKDEIFVFQLVGASNSFIRRPFLYTGMWYGFFGSVLACILVGMFFYWLNEPSKLLGQLYGGVLIIKGLDVINVLSLLGVGTFLGVLGSWVVLHRYLVSV